jgi:hypothetical protein
LPLSDNTILATPGVSFVAVTDGFVDFADGQRTTFINVSLLYNQVPLPAQVLTVNLTGLTVISPLNETFYPIFGEYNTFCCC